jgi:hypothetical protein
LAVGGLGVIAILRITITGSASLDGVGLRREDQPEVYWTVLLASLLVTGFLLGRGFGIW